MPNLTTMTRQRMQRYVDNVVGVWDDTLLHLLDALTASVEAVNGERVDGALMELIEYLEGTKNAIKAAIEAKGVTVPDDASFRDYAELIGQIGTSGPVPLGPGSNQYTISLPHITFSKEVTS